VTVSEAAPAVQAEIDRLQNDFGVNKIILVSHLQDVDNDRALIQELSGVDIAVAGGGDDFLVNPSLPVSSQAIPTEEEDVEGDYPLTEVGADGGTVYIVTSVDKYRYLGRLDVTFGPAGNVVSIDTSDSYPRRVVLSGPVATSLGLSDAVEPDATLVSQVNEPLQVALEDLANDVIANTEILFNVSRDDVRGGESNIGNLVSDAFLDSYDRYEELVGLSPRSPTNPVVAVQNGGGIRQNAGDTLPRDGQVPGPISRLDTIDVLPFNNTISVVQDVTPADLLAVLDNRSTSGIYQVAGLNLVYNTVTDAEGTTYVIDSITLENTDGTTTPLVTGGAVDPAAPATITVVTNSFVANREFAANTNQTDLRDDEGVLILYEQPLREYLQTFPEVGGVPTIPADDPRYQPATDDTGRIIIQP
jgi:5'-nucleotidase